MDFNKIKQEALKLKKTAADITNNAIKKTSNFIFETGIVIKKQEELNELIEKSKNTTYTDDNGDLKTSIKRSLIIVGDFNNDSFKKFIISLPIIITKAFSQNVSIKIIDSNNDSININDYNLQEFPSILVFQNKELIKLIYGKENINKLITSLEFDINKTIDNL